MAQAKTKSPKDLYQDIGKEEFTIKPGDRIAQALVKPTAEVELIRVSKVSETER